MGKNKLKNFTILKTLLLIVLLIILLTTIQVTSAIPQTTNKKNTTAGAPALLSGMLERDTTLTSANNPWQIDADLVVPANITLTITAGVIVHFNANATLIIESDGQLVAAGAAESRILFTRNPDAQSKWRGIKFLNTYQDNYLGYVDMLDGDAGSYLILVDNSKLLIENMTWVTLNKTVLEVDHPQLIVQNSIFPSVESVEVVHGQSLEGDEYFILEGNTFGSTTGYNDVIDFSNCKRPGPILQACNNIFLGGGDDGLDLDGCDAHVEGNYFVNFHRDTDNPGTSNAVSTGERYNRTSDITLVRNIFINNDHSVLLKEDCFLHAENNVFYNNTEAVVNYSEWPLRNVAPGKGAAFIGNIFWNNTALFENQVSQPGNPDPVIQVQQCIIDSAYHSFGAGNIDADPLFVDEDGDFHLQPGSPAIGAGPNGLDMGRYVPAGASISGEPDSITTETTATLTIGGPGITHYSYNINNSADNWSDEISIQDQPVLQLSGLQPGTTYTVYVKGKNSAGAWQQQPEFATSKTWLVDTLNTGIDQAKPQQLPAQCRLYQNTPNPFNPVTTISFELAQEGHVTLEIFNLHGQKVAVLAKEDYQQGAHHITWNAATIAGGVYFCRLRHGNYTSFMKMLLLK